MILFSVDGHHFAFLYDKIIIIVSFAIRNKAALRTLMQIYMAIYMAQHIFFPRSLRNKMFFTIRHKHKSIYYIVLLC